MDIYASLGFIMTIVSWIAGIYMVRNWRGNKTMSISQHAASATNAGRLFAAVLTIGGLVFYLWLITWFTNELQLPVLFIVLVSLSFVGQIVAAIVPDTQGWSRTVHRVAAYSMAVLYIPAVWLIVLGETSLTATVIGSITIGYMMLTWFLFIFIKKSKEHYLIFQAAYIVAFQCTILVAAYS